MDEHLEAHLDIYAGLHGKSMQFTKGGGDMTTCCENFDELW